MIEVKQRITRINKLRKQLGMRFDRRLSLELNSLLASNVSDFQSAMASNWWTHIQNMLEESVEIEKSNVFQLALEPGAQTQVAYHKAIAEVCLKILQFNSDMLAQEESLIEEKGKLEGMRVGVAVGESHSLLSTLSRANDRRIKRTII